MMLRLSAVAILLLAILVYAWSGQVTSNQQNGKAATSEATSRIFAANDIVEEDRDTNATTVRNSASVTRLDGNFSPDNESLLIEQLTRAGYIYMSSYRAGNNRGATIVAMKGKSAIQPFLTITVDKDGKATSTE